MAQLTVDIGNAETQAAPPANLTSAEASASGLNHIHIVPVPVECSSDTSPQLNQVHIVPAPMERSDSAQSKSGSSEETRKSASGECWCIPCTFPGCGSEHFKCCVTGLLTLDVHDFLSIQKSFIFHHFLFSKHVRHVLICNCWVMSVTSTVNP